jgi:hypothetical protein
LRKKYFNNCDGILWRRWYGFPYKVEKKK